MPYKYLNLACGDFYLKSSDWVNLDWYPHSKYVEKANLLAKLRFEDESFDVIYTSHFIEHIPLQNLNFVLSECFRVLKPEGVIRIVVPDLENIVREYIRNLDNRELDKAEFNSIELLDQCVRSKSGGNLASWRGRQDLTQELRKYVSHRTGYIYKISTIPGVTQSKTSHLRFPKITRARIQWAYCKLITKLMPGWFVQNHVNFTNTGELHKWVYDENLLSKHLAATGFRDVTRYSPQTSRIHDFPFVPLDLDENLNVRKGEESMYIEALK